MPSKTSRFVTLNDACLNLVVCDSQYLDGVIGCTKHSITVALNEVLIKKINKMYDYIFLQNYFNFHVR